jgi:hypothetical protein
MENPSGVFSSEVQPVNVEERADPSRIEIVAKPIQLRHDAAVEHVEMTDTVELGRNIPLKVMNSNEELN